MSPEVVLKRDMGLPMDIWSVGCVVVEMATGKVVHLYSDDPFHIVTRCRSLPLVYFYFHSFPGLSLKTSSRSCISLVVRRPRPFPMPRSSRMDTTSSEGASFLSQTEDGKPFSFWDTTSSKYVYNFMPYYGLDYFEKWLINFAGQ